MTKTICRWGFLGAAEIARKNWKSVRMSGNGVVAAVASRDVERAEAFIHDCSLECPPVVIGDNGEATLTRPVAIGSYDELLLRDDIDAVYIAIPTALRKKWVIAAAKAGKHVVCEKPVAVHGDDADEMIQACRDAGVGFMDGVMFDHSARLPELRRCMKDEHRFGKLRRILTHFSFCGDESFEQSNIRANADLEPHGCLGDLGWYCIRMSLWANGFRMPTAVSGRSVSTFDDGRVPSEFQGELRFDNEVSAGLFCSFLTANQQTATLSGDRGYVTLDDFVLPFVDAEAKWAMQTHDMQIDNCRWNFGRHVTSHAVKEHASGEADSQEVRMIRNFAFDVLQNAHQISPGSIHAADVALKTQRVLDALRRSDIESGNWVSVDASH